MDDMYIARTRLTERTLPAAIVAQVESKKKIRLHIKFGGPTGIVSTPTMALHVRRPLPPPTTRPPLAEASSVRRREAFVGTAGDPHSNRTIAESS